MPYSFYTIFSSYKTDIGLHNVGQRGELDYYETIGQFIENFVCGLKYDCMFDDPVNFNDLTLTVHSHGKTIKFHEVIGYLLEIRTEVEEEMRSEYYSYGFDHSKAYFGEKGDRIIKKFDSKNLPMKLITGKDTYEPSVLKFAYTKGKKWCKPRFTRFKIK